MSNLWRSHSAHLGTIAFSGESGSGRRRSIFSTPVAGTPGTHYVASYYGYVGRYLVNGGYFTSSGADNGLLHALAAGVGGKSIHRHGSSGGFPLSSFNASLNYWVDGVYQVGA
jgi:hypothetical protein